MFGHRRRWRTLRAVTIFLIIAPLVVASSPASPPGRVAETARLPDGMLMAASGPCDGAYQIDESGMCTHGSDPVPDLIRRRDGPTLQSGLASADGVAVGCDGDGTSGKRIQPLYVYVDGRANRRSTFIGSFRSWAAKVDGVFEESAQLTGGSRRLRWVTNSSCLLAVPAVALSTSAETSFSAMISELTALGHNRNDRKYLVWFDSDPAKTGMCGIASVWGDDSPVANTNDDRTGYARADYVCWDFAEQHELMHTLGAVQGSAPHASAGLHCTDEYDQMCYADGPGVELTYPCDYSMEALFDCGHDDYFSTDPAPDSYLATHWNVANSSWLIAADPPPSPPPNDNFSAAQVLPGIDGTVSGTNAGATAEDGEQPNTATSAPIGSVWYSWTAGQDGTALFDTCSSAFDTTIGAYTGTDVGSLAQLVANDDDPAATCGSNSRIEFAAQGGLTYHVSVDGDGAAQGAIVLNHTFVPGSADLTPPAVDPVGIEIAAGVALGKKSTLHVSWPASSDPSGIVAYELQRRKGSRAWVEVTLPTPTATAVDVRVARGRTYSFRLRAHDGAGNTGAWTESAPIRLGLIQENATPVSYSGTFKRAALTGASGGYVRHSSLGGHTSTLTFTGEGVAFVTTLARKRGMVDVRIDGGDWTRLDLYAASRATKRVVWAAAPSPGTHTLEVRVTGVRNPSATRTRVDIDAFLVLD